MKLTPDHLRSIIADVISEAKKKPAAKKKAPAKKKPAAPKKTGVKEVESTVVQKLSDEVANFFDKLIELDEVYEIVNAADLGEYFRDDTDKMEAFKKIDHDALVEKIVREVMTKKLTATVESLVDGCLSLVFDQVQESSVDPEDYEGFEDEEDRAGHFQSDVSAVAKGRKRDVPPPEEKKRARGGTRASWLGY